jgi:hypothetical protein
MKINKIQIPVFTLLLLLTFIGCDDEDFLTEKPKTFYTTDNIFSSETQVDQVLVTLYSDLRNFRHRNYQAKGFSTDVMDAPEFRIATTFGDYSRINPESSQFSDTYNFYYELIATANTALFAANLESISFESEGKRLYMIAQARFFRAYAHGILAELFGGVPIVTETVSEPRYDYVRESRADTYQFAIEELEAILENLPETTTQDGRVVKGAAQHYLSEFYLGLGIETSSAAAYDKAIKYASDVIAGPYALMTERFGERKDEPGKDVYWDLFRIDNVNYSDGNTESIWTFQVDFDAFLAEDGQSYLNYPRYYMPVYRAIIGFDGVAEDAGGRGVAFYKQTPYAGDLVWDASISSNDQRGAEHNIIRTIIYNDPVGFPDLAGKEIPQDVIDFHNEGRGWVYPIIFKLTTDQFVGLDQGQNRSNLFRDEYAIRLAETILLRAEAHHRKGDNLSAANDINMIRTRAQCDIMAAAADVDIDFILDERARELFGEECRWNTLLRMGGTVAVDRIRKYAMHPITPLTLTFDYNLWAIPQSTIDRNKDVPMAQNPGWDNR